MLTASLFACVSVCVCVFVYTPVICAKHARCLKLGANTSQWVRPSSYFPGAVSNIYGALKVAVHARMNVRFSHRAELRAKFQLSVFRVRGCSPSKSHNNRNLTDRFPFKRRGCSFSFGSDIQYYCTPVKAYGFFFVTSSSHPTNTVQSKSIIFFKQL